MQSARGGDAEVQSVVILQLPLCFPLLSSLFTSRCAVFPVSYYCTCVSIYCIHCIVLHCIPCLILHPCAKCISRTCALLIKRCMREPQPQEMVIIILILAIFLYNVRMPLGPEKGKTAPFQLPELVPF